MVWLVLGVALWMLAHLGKSAGRGIRSTLIEKVGEDPYKGLIAMSVLSALVLMVIGWRATLPSLVYASPVWAPAVTQAGMLIALLLFSASVTPNWVSANLRHPQLTGVATWAGAHLVANGDQRSLVLFGGLAIWAIVSLFAINQRDGAWKRPEAQPFSTIVKPLFAAGIGFAVLWLTHSYFTGRPLVWGW